MATLGTYFYDGTSFQFATVLCTDSSLTTTAPDGWYSQGGISRAMIGGILDGPQTCPSCIYACGDVALTTFNKGRYVITIDVGLTTGAVIAKFQVPNASLARATWTYDGLSASEYSSEYYGYLQGVLGNEYYGILYPTGVGNCINNAQGSDGDTFTDTEYANVGNTFIPTGITPTWGPYLNQASGGCDLINIPPSSGLLNLGICTMVIPKPNATPSALTFVIDGPLCANPYWTLEVLCPADLSPMQMFYGPGISCPDASTTPLSATYYYYNASANPYPQLYDWVFTDIQGVTPLANGFYFVLDPNYPASGNMACIEVENGVIKSKV